MTCYILIVILFYLIAEDQLQFRVDQTEMPQANSSTGELVSGTEVRRSLLTQINSLVYPSSQQHMTGQIPLC